MNGPAVAAAEELASFSASERLAPKHSTYSELVQADEDMVGHVAYALYKRDKLKFCETIASKHRRAVSQGEIEAFIQTSNLENRLTAYRSEAERLLERFSEEVLDGTLGRLQDEMNHEMLVKLQHSKSWSRAILENLIANVLALAVAALLILITYGSRIGLVPLLADVFGYDVKEKVSASPPSAPDGTK